MGPSRIRAVLGPWLREGVIVADDVIELELVDPTSAGLANGHIYLPCSGRREPGRPARG